MRDPRERLQDMFEAIEHIERYASRGRDTFERDELIQNWIVRHLQIIGEAARAMPQEVRERATNIPWAKIIACVTFSSMTTSRSTRRSYGMSLNTTWRG
jgi:uncharacterized protein with HEPN domain